MWASEFPVSYHNSTPRPSGRIRFFVSQTSIQVSHLKIGSSLVIWPKNDAKQQQQEKKKKENVGFFSVNSSFFLARKKRNHRQNLPFYLIRYDSSRDSSSPYETKNLIQNQIRSSRLISYSHYSTPRPLRRIRFFISQTSIQVSQLKIGANW